MKAHDDRVATFHRLHSSGCFVMPNPWDAGSARALEQLGFKALATTSAGFAWTLGRADNQVTLDQALEHLRVVADAGADCLYAPRIDSVEHVAAIIAAVSPKPVNLLINAPFMTVAEAASLGVRRISVGGTLARTAWAGFLQAAREIADEGTFSRFERLPNVDALFRDRVD